MRVDTRDAEIDRLTKELTKSVEHSEQYRRNWLSLQDATGEQCLIHALTWIREAKEMNTQLRQSLRQIAAMDYTRAATNGMGYDVVKLAIEALRKAGEL